MAAESGSSATKTPSHRWVLPRALLPPKTGWQPEPEPLPVPSPRAGWAAAAADMAPAPFGCQPGQRGPRAHRCLRKPVASAGGGVPAPRRRLRPQEPRWERLAAAGAAGAGGGERSPKQLPLRSLFSRFLPLSLLPDPALPSCPWDTHPSRRHRDPSLAPFFQKLLKSSRKA